MATYKISYFGWTTTTVEANSIAEAEEKFWLDGRNELYDAEITDVIEIKKESQST